MSTCSNCGTEMSAGQLFCRECGAKSIRPAAGRKKVDLDEIKTNLPNFPNPTVIKDRTSETFKNGASAVKNSSLGVVKRIKTGSVDLFKKRPKLIIGLGVGVVLAIAYISVQTVILNQNSPEAQVTKIVNAANAKDFTALQDQDLFPNPNNYPVLPSSMQGIYSADPLQIGSSTSSLFSDDAYVNIDNGYSQVAQVHLVATNSWNFIFYQREWKVVSEAPTVRFSTANIGQFQRASFGDVSFSGRNDPDLNALVGKTYVAFPGDVTVSTDAYGFEDASSDSVSITGDTVLQASAGELVFPSDLESQALTKAEATATWCASSECSFLPYFSDSDYSWDDDPTWDFYYDYSYSNDAFSSWGCTQDSAQATSATSGYVDFSCDIHSSKVVTHVVDYYYLSDDYTYFTGSGSQYMYLTVRYSFNPATGKYSVTSVTG